ncbi:Aminoglycoside phosphotransferase [Nocardia otitidiscaviarum]|uniref:Aminoglycoside phosphotransferase n=1 Tax=Nocardia otitidiscaviarum TaxID=1823 RepID=A0A378Y708_9NOCA|nr:aminoglycoside phosphotransferase family protein [Nocardia otitidiscaviarum]SUA72874.1 Aminoglycoside phosphotransferase [Nocardia otitidiscaviarum]
MNRVPVTPSGEILARAAQIAALDMTGSSVIRDGSHAIYQLPGQVVARIGRPGTADDAARELAVSRWLNASGVNTVEPVPNLPQPIVVDGRPVTWWRLVPNHRTSTPPELGVTLRALHALPVPSEPALPEYDPFVGLRERLAAASTIDHDDRAWLLRHHDDLQARYSRDQSQQTPHVIHGDAWQGNLVVTIDSGVPTLLDLDKVSTGHPDWDLIQIAVDHTDFHRISDNDYRLFVDAYGGYDVTASPRFRLLADIQELRWVGFALDRADTSSEARQQAHHRIACLRGTIPKPWIWAAL